MKLLIGLFLAAGLSGCVIHAHPGPPPRHETVVVEEEYRPQGNVVVVERVHVHDAGCGHYWYNGSWYLHTGHRHGPNCGHVYHDGYWVGARQAVVVQGHVHDAHCGHYYSGSSVYYMHGHHHGPGCGHSWNGKLWISVRF